MARPSKSTGMGRRVKRRMKQLGLTQQQVADGMDWTQGQISHLCLGRVLMVQADSVFKLADILQCDPRWLATGLEA